MNNAGKIQTQIDIILHSLNFTENELTDFANEHSLDSRLQLSIPGEVVLEDGEGKRIALLTRDDNYFWTLTPSEELDKLQFPR